MSDSESQENSENSNEDVENSENESEENSDDDNSQGPSKKVSKKDKKEKKKEIKENVEYTQEQLNAFRDEINTLCLNIFLNFSKYFYEEKDFLLSFQTVTKLLTDMGVIVSNTKKIPPNKKGKFHIKSFEFDLLLKKISPKKVSKINSTQFLNLIVLLSSKYDPKKFKTNPKGTLYNFVNDYFGPLAKYINEYDSKENPNLFPYRAIDNSINELNKAPIDQKTLTIISNIYKGIAFIYKYYFPFENNKTAMPLERLIKESMTNLVEFSKDYEITPYLLTIDKIAIYFNCLIDKNENEIFEGNLNFGHIFTINKFCLFLINTANNIFASQRTELWGRLILLLNKMENSKGKTTQEKKFNVMRSEGCSLQLDPDVEKGLSEPSEEELKKKEEEEKKEKEEEEKKSESESDDNDDEDDKDEDDESESASDSEDKSDNEDKKEKKEKKKKEKEEKKIIPENINYEFVFHNIFDNYATIGDKLNFSQMTVTSYIKFLKDFKVFDMKVTPPPKPKTGNKNTDNKNTIQSTGQKSTITLAKTERLKGDHLTEIEANMIFCEICGLKNSKKNVKQSIGASTCLEKKEGNVSLRMSYPQFMNIFEIIASKLHPGIPPKDAFNLFQTKDLKLAEYYKNGQSSYLQIIEILKTLNKSNAKKILIEFEPIVFSIYNTNADINGNLPFQNFFRIFKDFEIFPELISMVDIKKLFFVLSTISREQKKDGASMQDFIVRESGDSPNMAKEYMEFVEGEKAEVTGYDYLLWSFGIASTFIKAKSKANDCDKLILLFTKMCKSKGVTNPRKLTGGGRLESINKNFIEILTAVKEKYPLFFEQKDKVKEIFNSENMFNYLFTD